MKQFFFLEVKITFYITKYFKHVRRRKFKADRVYFNYMKNKCMKAIRKGLQVPRFTDYIN